jgi:predicted membrane protein
MFLIQLFVRVFALSATLFILISALVGCKQELTYSYLMKHPNVLKQEVAECQSIDEKSNENIKQCQITMNAAADLILIINEQQDDPEKFGQKILDSEIAAAKAKEKMYNAQQVLNRLKSENSPEAEIKAAQNELHQAREDYKQRRENVKVLLAVVSMNSPE